MELRKLCKGVHILEVGGSFHMSINLQGLASIQTRTSLVKLARSPCTDPPGRAVDWPDPLRPRDDLRLHERRRVPTPGDPQVPKSGRGRMSAVAQRKRKHSGRLLNAGACSGVLLMEPLGTRRHNFFDFVEMLPNVIKCS